MRLLGRSVEELCATVVRLSRAHVGNGCDAGIAAKLGSL
jgi:hypothetical protein